MKLNYSGIALFVQDIEIAKFFYSKTLNIPIELDLGKNVIFKGGITVWEISHQHAIPLLLGSEKIADHGSNRFELYFETDNLEEIESNLKNKGTRFLHEIHQESWGQQTIRFFDPDNHLIEIGESMKIFVSRFYQKGMSIEEVSARTSVPVEEVKRLIG